jgi:HNH endonuclease
MQRCLFCEKEYEKLSNEHVFPAALGGNLELRDGVCTNCNNEFSKFERVLAKELGPIRLLLNIPDRYGDIPSADAVAKTKDGEYKATTNADGTIQVRPIVTVTAGEGGNKEIRFQYATDKQVEQVKQAVADKKLELLEFEVRPAEQADLEVAGELK